MEVFQDYKVYKTCTDVLVLVSLPEWQKEDYPK